MKEVAGFFIVITIVIVAFIYGILAVGGRVELPAKLARIEQLRSDVKKINSNNSEDVIGQVTFINQEIVEYKAYNKLWYFDLLIPDEWDSVQLIEIPK